LVLLSLAGLVAASFGLSLALDGGWARRSLLARLAAGFGRPVEVGGLGFNLLSGLRLEAQSVTVADDPQFGHEYFLRAERLTASLRWSALVHGRFEFDTVSLTRPSLNLVRLPDGRWNIESWLPPPQPAEPPVLSRRAAGLPAVPPPSGGVPARISRIQVDRGRINFKRGSLKLPLALVAVSGHLDRSAAGRWNIDLAADPMRAPAALQQAGTLRLRGVVGGVSARLRPAAFSLAWERASLADLTRLLHGRDYGVRGMLDAELSATLGDISPGSSVLSDWEIEGTIRLQGVHGWALPGRSEDPGANVNFQARWAAGEPRLVVSPILVESPRSRLEATMDLDWSKGVRPAIQVSSSRLALADLLDWRRALLAGVSDDLAVEGALDAQAILSGWPLRVEHLALSGAGAEIQSASLPGPIRLGAVATRWVHDSLVLRPLPVDLPTAEAAASSGTASVGLPSAGALRVEGSVGPLRAIGELRDAAYRVAVSGSTQRAQDLLAVARAWGWSTSSGWNAEGPLSLQLAWTGALGAETPVANGTIEARDLQLTTALLNQPLLVSSASIELRRGRRRVNLAAVQALGADWTGSLVAPTDDGPWTFDLSAGRLDAADLNEWLAMPDRPSFLRRMLPFAAPAAPGDAPARADALDRLNARGRLRVGQLLLSPLRVEKMENLDAQAALQGSSILLREVRAELYGGRLTGDFQARLSPEPAYSFDGQFLRLDLRELASAASLPGSGAGWASGELQLSARGSDRAALAASLEGRGQLRVRDAALVRGEWMPPAALNASGHEPDPGSRRYSITTSFQVGDGRVLLDPFLLGNPDEQVEITGSVDFQRQLDLRVRSLPRPVAAAVGGSDAENSVWTVGGTLDAPLVTPQPVAENGSGFPLASR
jgi:hypothetical protein